MDRRASRDKCLRDDTRRDKRLRRRRVILGIWGLIQRLWSLVKSLFGWIMCVITFKKSVIVYFLAYVTYYSESTRRFYISIGLPVPDSVHNTVVTVFLGQLALTAISSLGSRAVEWVETKYEAMDNNDDINYG